MIPKTETLYGPWDYRKRGEQSAYDDTPSYRIAGEFLSGDELVEDWGAGMAWASRYIHAPYRAIDGAWSRWADEVVDLRTYRSNVPRALMRHVLEHNDDWRVIAANFSASWRDRAALVLFIPPQPADVITSEPDWPVPDIAVSGPDLMEILDDGATAFDYQELVYPPEDSIQWGWEGVLLMQR